MYETLLFYANVCVYQQDLDTQSQQFDGCDDVQEEQYDDDESVHTEVTQATNTLQNETSSVPTKKRNMKNMAPPTHPTKVLKTGMTTKHPSRFETAINKLQSIAELASSQPIEIVEDQYDKFAKHIASQLRELPMRSFVSIQNQFQQIITNERLRHLDMAAYSPSTADLFTLHNAAHSSNANGLDILQQALVGLDPNHNANN